jgi:hypothetical protein
MGNEKLNDEKRALVSEAMRIIRSVNSEAQQAAARENGKRGGRPPGTAKPLSEISCNCGATADDAHKSTCPRGRAYRRRMKSASESQL